MAAQNLQSQMDFERGSTCVCRKNYSNLTNKHKSAYTVLVLEEVDSTLLKYIQIRKTIDSNSKY